jgi:hypothetical protein
MSYLTSTSGALASAATDLQGIGSAIGAAGSTAAAPTTGLLAAAGDEVSGAIANLFGTYGQQYQALLAQAANFHHQFTQALAAAGGAYLETEASNAALVAGINEITTPIRTLLGQAPATAGGSAGAGLRTSMLTSAANDPLFALIMGGTGNATPDPTYVKKIYNAYIKPNPLFSSATPLGVFTPEQFWPVTPQLGNMTFGQSVAKGVGLLNNAITSLLSNPSNSAVVFGYSQSATIATDEIRALMAAGSPYQGQLSFMLIGDPNNPVGGLLERFPGFYIPFLDVSFNGATPPNSPYPTSIYTLQYDGIADAPQYPLNVLSDVNALMGYFFVHGTYPDLTATQISNAVLLPTSPGYSGNTQYYMLMSQNLPLLQPIRDIPYAGPPIADIFQPDLRVLVDMGYADYGPGGTYANVPTPAGLFEIPNPLAIVPDMVLGTFQGPYGAIVEIGVEAGLTSPSAFPTTYPWTPSIDPHLNFSFGQSSTTLLSLISGAAGNVLDVIPAPVLSSPSGLGPERRGLPDRLVADQTPQQRGAELGGDFLGGTPSARPQPAVAAQRHPDVAQGHHVRVAFVKLATGDPAVDEPVHVLVDLSLLLAHLGDLFGGEPFGDVGLFLEVDGRPLWVGRDAGQQAHGVLIERLARRPRRVVVHRGQRALCGLAIDVEQDQRLAGVVVVNGRLVQADHVGDVVHPGAVIAARGEQFGGNNQQLLTAGLPVLGWHRYSLSSLSAGVGGPRARLIINQLVGQFMHDGGCRTDADGAKLD